MPFAPDASVDETVRKPPGMPPGAAVSPEVVVAALDSPIGVALSVLPLYPNARSLEFSPITKTNRCDAFP
jgi:hypothetical protein